jgi:type VI secretion system protein ImpM
LGDFASRRLGPEFIEPWDDWLAGGLAALRQARPDAWLAEYLASPSWRFLLLPGVLPGAASQQAWAGVLMPSVDRVGRYFPLTLALPAGAGPACTQQLQGLWHWLALLDELARDALFEDWTAERLDEALAALALPERASAPRALALPPGASGRMVQAPAAGSQDPAWHIGAQAQQAWAERARGQAWWHACPDHHAPRLQVSLGLPEAGTMAALFGAAATI